MKSRLPWEYTASPETAERYIVASTNIHTLQMYFFGIFKNGPYTTAVTLNI